MPTATKTIVYKEPVTGEFVEVPAEQAPPLHPVAPEPAAGIPASLSRPDFRAFNVLGEEVSMERAYYRGQYGLNSYSTTVRLGQDIFFIEELSGEDFQVFKAQARDLKMTTQMLQEGRDAGATQEDEEEQLLDLVKRKYVMHRTVVEKCVRGCTNASLATKEGRDALYHGAVEALCTSIISASLLGRGESDFLT